MTFPSDWPFKVCSKRRTKTASEFILEYCTLVPCWRFQTLHDCRHVDAHDQRKRIPVCSNSIDSTSTCAPQREKSRPRCHRIHSWLMNEVTDIPFGSRFKRESTKLKSGRKKAIASQYVSLLRTSHRTVLSSHFSSAHASSKRIVYDSTC